MANTVLITGASRGIGRACALAFAKAGYRVAVHYNHSAAQAETLVQQLRETGCDAACFRADIADSAQVNELVQQATAFLGHIDVLVCSAGIALQQLFTDTTDLQWRELMGADLDGVFYACRGVLPGMIARQQGVIVNLASVNAYVGTTFGCDYSAAKHGLIGLTKSIALCGAPHHVRCVGVAPGPVLTRETMSKMTTPLGRAAEVSEVVDMIDYLVSDKAAFVTGSTHVIDGGFTCR